MFIPPNLANPQTFTRSMVWRSDFSKAWSINQLLFRFTPSTLIIHSRRTFLDCLRSPKFRVYRILPALKYCQIWEEIAPQSPI